jgi:hypothetical protein
VFQGVSQRGPGSDSQFRENSVQLRASSARARWKSILTKLQLPATDDNHRRVLAVLMFLDSR